MFSCWPRAQAATSSSGDSNDTQLYLSCLHHSPASWETVFPHARVKLGRVSCTEVRSDPPDSQSGDDFSATRSRQHGQETLSVPLGDVARRVLPVSFMGDLDCVQPQSVLLVFHLPKAGTNQNKPRTDGWKRGEHTSHFKQSVVYRQAKYLYMVSGISGLVSVHLRARASWLPTQTLQEKPRETVTRCCATTGSALTTLRW